MRQDEVRWFLHEICDLIEEHLEDINATRFQITIKEDGTPVTESDVFVENLVQRYVRERIPNVEFIGEESFDFIARNTDSYIMLLDPIDGTENFCSGLREWGVSCGLWLGGRHLGSFLLMPELGLRLVTGDHVEPISSRITGLSSSISPAFFEIMEQTGEYRIMGCAVYNIYNVITGSFRRFINPKGAYVWDILPGVMLALEHGCKVLINGKPYQGEYLDPTLKYRVDIER